MCLLRYTWPALGNLYIHSVTLFAITSILLWDLRGPLDAKEVLVDVNEAWLELTTRDGKTADRADRSMVAAADRAVAHIDKNLKPGDAIRATAERLNDLIAKLDDANFKIRERATAELLDLGPQAEPALCKAAVGKQSAEARRRTTQLLERAGADNSLLTYIRPYRAVEVLELISSLAARRLLGSYAQGDPDTILTQQARAALARLGAADGMKK